MAAVVIADASPLIALARVGGITWLQQLFGEVLVTPEVLQDVLTGQFAASEQPIHEALHASWLRCESNDANNPALPDLDEGEAASIRVALDSSEQALLLIDERAGRAVATELGLRVADTAAVIGTAKQQVLTRSARAVIQAVLDRCGEASPEPYGLSRPMGPLP